MIRNTIQFLLAVVLLTSMASCGDDDPSRPPFEFPATLQSLWPYEDGRGWNFDLTTQVWEVPGDPLYESEEEVPPIPPWDELYERLQDGFEGSPDFIGSGNLNLYFDGEVAISPGDTVPRLRSIVQVASGNPKRPMQLGGGLWRRGDTAIESYSEEFPNSGSKWVYLTDELEPGDEFSHQLAPGLADDVWLRCRIWRHMKAELPGGARPNAVECIYLIDMGVQQATDEGGQSLGYLRSLRYGLIVYAENVGPVYCVEHWEESTLGMAYDFKGFRLTRSTAELMERVP